MIILETERLFLRKIISSDEDAFFEMDSDPEVHTFLGNKPAQTIEEIREVIQRLHRQYAENGIGRWAVIEKSSGKFIGWSGLKFIAETKNKHINFYDIGYRLNRQYWGKGYATESSKAILRYAFTEMNLEEVFATTHEKNLQSQKILKSIGLNFVEIFEEERGFCHWFKITKEEYLSNVGLNV